jgi:predicted transcriptional regulator
MTPNLPSRRVVNVCNALSNAVRWRAIQRIIAVGQPMSVSQLAARERLSGDAMSRHMQVMEKAGVVASHPGVDRRCTCYFVPEQFRQTPGMLDFGCVKVQLEK